MAIAGRILILPKGEYNASTTYSMLDLVSYNGASWLAKKTAVGIEPSDANSEYWQKLIEVAGKQDTITGGATSITDNNLTVSRALVSDANGKVAVSVVTATELGYLDGATGNIQTQLNNKSASSHTHKYAGSSSAGGSATTALACTGNSATATKATQDSQGQQINTTYIKGVSANGNVLTITKGNGTTSNITLTTGDDATVRYNSTTDMVEILVDGEWVEMMSSGVFKQYLFQNGGNLAEIATYAGSTVGTGGGATKSLTTENNNLKFVVTATGYTSASILTKQIDVTSYDKIVMKYELTTSATPTDYEKALLFVTSAKATAMTAQASVSFKSALASASGTIELDISNVSGSMYIGVELANNAKTQTLKISEWYLE